MNLILEIRDVMLKCSAPYFLLRNLKIIAQQILVLRDIHSTFLDVLSLKISRNLFMQGANLGEHIVIFLWEMQYLKNTLVLAEQDLVDIYHMFLLFCMIIGLKLFENWQFT